MKALFIFLLTHFIFVISLNADEINFTQKELTYIKNHPVIKVSNEDDWQPFDFSENGEAKGYSIDLIKHLAKKIGIKVEFVNGYTWTGLLELFDNKKIDMMHVMARDEERLTKYSFSKTSYLKWQLSYYIRTDEKDIKSQNDFDGKKVSLGRNWVSTQKIKELFPNLIIKTYDKSSDMLLALSNHEVDIHVNNGLVISYIKSEYNINNIKRGGILHLGDYLEEDLYFVSHKDEPELSSIFSKAFNNMPSYKKVALQNRWFLYKE